MKLWLAGCLTLGCCGAWGVCGAVAPRPDDSPRSIETIMKEMKSGLAKKVTEGAATAEERALLLDMLIDLYANDPPQGDPAQWKQATANVLADAAKVVVGREDSAAALKKSLNCAACHKVFKPKSESDSDAGS